MIKREDVIIDPTDPRVEGLIGKKVYMGCSYAEIKDGNVLGSLDFISGNSNCFRSVEGYGYTMIAQIPEPTYRPFRDDEEFRPYRDAWIKMKGHAGALNLSSYGDDGACCNGIFFSWEIGLKNYTFEDGTPFGVKE